VFWPSAVLLSVLWGRAHSMSLCSVGNLSSSSGSVALNPRIRCSQCRHDSWHDISISLIERSSGFEVLTPLFLNYAAGQRNHYTQTPSRVLARVNECNGLVSSTDGLAKLRPPRGSRSPLLFFLTSCLVNGLDILESIYGPVAQMDRAAVS
jgi:hypothetical protein